jgi:hypothetical protein
MSLEPEYRISNFVKILKRKISHAQFNRKCVFKKRGNQSQNAESKSRGRIANSQYKIKTECIVQPRHTKLPNKAQLHTGQLLKMIMKKVTFREVAQDTTTSTFAFSNRRRNSIP